MRTSPTLTTRRRFAIATSVAAVFFLVLGLVWGPSIALTLQDTPTTTNGWLFIGWLIGGPPFPIACLLWFERSRMKRTNVIAWTYAMAVVCGANLFILPARVFGVSWQFGTAGILVGDPLSAGWVWGVLANVVGGAFTGLVLLILNKSTATGPTRAQRAMTARFLERAWLVGLIVTLGFALYGGNGAGIFNNGT
ncbi:MAG: hypothetical protein JWR52_1454 [Marmoricola sp.]|nr:hypothetical protein [Marmoricola sp.]